MPSAQSEETRLNIRLSGRLAEHVNRQIESALYHTHSEYIRDLIRHDMEREDAALLASVRRGLDDIEHGRHHPFDAEALRARAKSELAAEQTAKRQK